MRRMTPRGRKSILMVNSNQPTRGVLGQPVAFQRVGGLFMPGGMY
jgi:hypothetical protein